MCGYVIAKIASSNALPPALKLLPPLLGPRMLWLYSNHMGGNVHGKGCEKKTLLKDA